MYFFRKSISYLNTANVSKTFIKIYDRNLCDKKPKLSIEEISQILNKNQKTIEPNFNLIKKIDCNQLASNSPVEDRIRVTRLNFNISEQFDRQIKSSKKFNSELVNLLLGVFDGHGGELCADLVASRLYSYIYIAIYNYKYKIKELNESINVDYLNSLTPNKFKNLKNKLLEDYYICPQLFHTEGTNYKKKDLDYLEELVLEEEKLSLINFNKELQTTPIASINDAIKISFVQLDQDISNEIKKNLQNFKSNIISHYYQSLAVSGCCVNIILIDKDNGYVASSGDCKAVLGIKNNFDEFKFESLSIEHVYRNKNEYKRILDNHPKEPHDIVLKNCRLLGQLMPLRAFGDFCYKWKKEEMFKYGLVSAFGPHIIPKNYLTPPYLIVNPEISEFKISKNKDEKMFIVLATDGLWDEFENAGKVINTMVKHKSKLKKNDLNDEDFDLNCATYLIRNALTNTNFTNFNNYLDRNEILKQNYERLIESLTLPKSLVRAFRDDISVVTIFFN